MLNLNKELTEQNIITFPFEKTLSKGNVSILKVHDKEESFILPQNISASDNYDEYVVPLNAFENLCGQYLYTIWEYNPSTNALINELEIGLLNIL